MHFLALLLVVALMWFTPLRTGLPLDLPKAWVTRVVRRYPVRQPLAGLLLVLLPLLILVLLQWWLQRNGLGLIGLLLFALVLLACVGRRASGRARSWGGRRGSGLRAERGQIGSGA